MGVFETVVFVIGFTVLCIVGLLFAAALGSMVYDAYTKRQERESLQVKLENERRDLAEAHRMLARAEARSGLWEDRYEEAISAARDHFDSYMESDAQRLAVVEKVQDIRAMVKESVFTINKNDLTTALDDAAAIGLGLVDAEEPAEETEAEASEVEETDETQEADLGAVFRAMMLAAALSRMAQPPVRTFTLGRGSVEPLQAVKALPQPAGSPFQLLEDGEDTEE